MKKFAIFIAALLLLSNVVDAANQIQVPARGRLDWNDTVQFDKKTVSGVDSLYTANYDTAIVNGASDSIYTKTFYNKGVFSFSVELSGGTTNRIVAEVQVANTGDDYAGGDIPDSLFQISQWIQSGTGVAGNTITTAIDSITSSGNLKTTPVKLYLENCEIFRILYYSTIDQVGNPRLISRVYLKRDQ